MSATKTRQIVWHECDESGAEDPDKDDTGVHIYVCKYRGWILQTDCHDGFKISYCPCCGKKLPVIVQKDKETTHGEIVDS